MKAEGGRVDGWRWHADAEGLREGDDDDSRPAGRPLQSRDGPEHVPLGGIRRLGSWGVLGGFGSDGGVAIVNRIEMIESVEACGVGAGGMPVCAGAVWQDKMPLCGLRDRGRAQLDGPRGGENPGNTGAKGVDAGGFGE
jgi:hypothetical protein